jgi:N-acetylglucosaminyldiphosphoundecaprenol N-acetyl-beta-D-mannosaminyltransferase
MERIDILGVPFDNLTKAQAVDSIQSAIERGTRGYYVVTPNPEIVSLCKDDPIARHSVSSADLIVADGIGIIKAAKILGTPLQEKIPGIELAQDLMKKMAQKNQSLFLFGGRPGIAEKAANKLLKKHPGLRVVGYHHGYFDEDADIIQAINRSDPDVVFVCLGAPKQENWMYAHRDSVSAKVMMGLGGSLDIFSETKKRAPKFFTDSGLEWLYRLIQEPKRIGRMAKLPLFLIEAMRVRGSCRERN